VKAGAEARFVTLCVREETSAAELHTAAADVRDWDLVVDLARRHRVTAFVLGADVGTLPPTARLSLQAEALSAQAVAMLLDSELERIGQALVDANVPVLVLKGPALARELYADRRLRPFADLDLTVREADEGRAAAVLADCGYQELAYDSHETQRDRVGHLHDSGAYHRLFAGAGERALVELHLDPLQLGVRAACETERWSRAVEINGLPGLRMLGPEDQVVQLSVHAHKHGFSRLIWLKDLDLLLRRRADTLSWELVSNAARREGVSASVWYALSLTHALLDTVLPEAVNGLRPALAVRTLYQAFWRPTAILNLRGFMRRRGVQFHAGDSWRGMLPSLILMGRRRQRLRLLANVVLNR
jgi:hypothetical protein